MTIWGAQHGKHVYVEKPMSHDVAEGRAAVAAQQKYGVVIQHGTQRRSNAGIAGLHEALQDGKLPRLKIAYGYCCKPRGSIGFKRPVLPQKISIGIFGKVPRHRPVPWQLCALQLALVLGNGEMATSKPRHTCLAESGVPSPQRSSWRAISGQAYMCFSPPVKKMPDFRYAPLMSRSCRNSIRDGSFIARSLAVDRPTSVFPTMT